MTSSEFTINMPLKSPITREPSGPSPCAACTVRELAVCSVLDTDELERLNSLMIDTSLSKGEYLFTEGDDAGVVFSINTGAVQLYKLLPDGRRQITGFHFSGDFLGLNNSQEYTYSAQAITDVKLCKFRYVDLKNLFKEFPKLESQLLSMARSELAEVQEQLLLLGRKTSIERVASFLLMLSDRAVKRGEPDNPVYVPMGGHGMGDYLGLTVETVSRAMARLKRLEVISKKNDYQSITILDKDKLVELAGGF